MLWYFYFLTKKITKKVYEAHNYWTFFSWALNKYVLPIYYFIEFYYNYYYFLLLDVPNLYVFGHISDKVLCRVLNVHF